MGIFAEWGVEVFFAVLTASVVGYAKWHGQKLRKEIEEAKRLAEEKEKEKIEAMIDTELEPIYQELEDLRKYIHETKNIEKTHMSLIIASYRFRLIQLCKGFLAQGYITASQMEQLSEFYKLYTGLGGNGQAKVYYDKTMNLDLVADEEDILLLKK